jgi:hypothetical protein
MLHHRRHIDRTTGKKLFKAAALVRGVGMQGKGSPVRLDGIRFSNFINTPGNEIAPGSDKIKKYLEPDE